MGEQEEEILSVKNKRYAIFPIKYNDVWEMYKKQEKSFWTAEEIDFSSDLPDWDKKLTSDEKYFIKHILAFFAGSDTIVLENLLNNFSQEVQIPEAVLFYGAQSYIEGVHSQTYSQLIETFIKDPKTKEMLFDAVNTIPCVKKKAEWAIKWMDSKNGSFAKRLIAFIVVEGIFFSSAFCAIYWLKSRGLMVKALGHSNELIARDEALHCNFGICLYGHLKGKLSEEEVHSIFKEAVGIENEFINESLPCKLIGMNSELMTIYIKYVADHWVAKLGYKEIYNVENPFKFMDLIGIDGKTNFFEKKVSEYTRASGVIDRDFEMDSNF